MNDNNPKISVIVPVYKADSAGEPETFRYTAQVMPIETVNITSRISADLVKVGFKDGEYVEKGRLLYTFDDTRYAAMYKSDKSKIEEYEAKLIYARNDYERTNELFKKGVSTKDEMESSLSQYKSYQASLLGAEADLILSEDDLKHCKIYSPISGVIGLTNYTEGNYITPSSGILATIVQLDPIRVKFSMSSRDFLENFSDIETLRKTCVVRLKLADDTFYDEEGEIEFINNEALLDKQSASAVVQNSKIIIPLKGLIDIEQEISRQNKKLDKLNQEKNSLQNRINNEKFVNSAPIEVVQKTKDRINEIEAESVIIKNLIDNLS